MMFNCVRPAVRLELRRVEFKPCAWQTYCKSRGSRDFRFDWRWSTRVNFRFIEGMNEGKLDDAALGCMSGVIIAAGGNACMIGTRFLLSCTTKK